MGRIFRWLGSALERAVWRIALAAIAAGLGYLSMRILEGGDRDREHDRADLSQLN